MNIGPYFSPILMTEVPNEHAKVWYCLKILHEDVSRRFNVRCTEDADHYQKVICYGSGTVAHTANQS